MDGQRFSLLQKAVVVWLWILLVSFGYTEAQQCFICGPKEEGGRCQPNAKMDVPENITINDSMCTKIESTEYHTKVLCEQYKEPLGYFFECIDKTNSQFSCRSSCGPSIESIGTGPEFDLLNNGNGLLLGKKNKGSLFDFSNFNNGNALDFDFGSVGQNLGNKGNNNINNIKNNNNNNNNNNVVINTQQQNGTGSYNDGTSSSSTTSGGGGSSLGSGNIFNPNLFQNPGLNNNVFTQNQAQNNGNSQNNPTVAGGAKGGNIFQFQNPFTGQQNNNGVNVFNKPNPFTSNSNNNAGGNINGNTNLFGQPRPGFGTSGAKIPGNGPNFDTGSPAPFRLPPVSSKFGPPPVDPSQFGNPPDNSALFKSPHDPNLFGSPPGSASKPRTAETDDVSSGLQNIGRPGPSEDNEPVDLSGGPSPRGPASGEDNVDDARSLRPGASSGSSSDYSPDPDSNPNSLPPPSDRRNSRLEENRVNEDPSRASLPVDTVVTEYSDSSRLPPRPTGSGPRENKPDTNNNPVNNNVDYNPLPPPQPPPGRDYNPPNIDQSPPPPPPGSTYQPGRQPDSTAIPSNYNPELTSQRDLYPTNENNADENQDLQPDYYRRQNPPITNPNIRPGSSGPPSIDDVPYPTRGSVPRNSNPNNARQGGDGISPTDIPNRYGVNNPNGRQGDNYDDRTTPEQPRNSLGPGRFANDQNSGNKLSEQDLQDIRNSFSEDGLTNKGISPPSGLDGSRLQGKEGLEDSPNYVGTSLQTEGDYLDSKLRDRKDGKKVPEEFEKPFEAQNNIFPGFDNFANGGGDSNFGTKDSLFNLFGNKNTSPPGFKNGNFNFNNPDFLLPLKYGKEGENDEQPKEEAPQSPNSFAQSHPGFQNPHSAGDLLQQPGQNNPGDSRGNYPAGPGGAGNSYQQRPPPQYQGQQVPPSSYGNYPSQYPPNQRQPQPQPPQQLPSQPPRSQYGGGAPGNGYDNAYPGANPYNGGPPQQPYYGRGVPPVQAQNYGPNPNTGRGPPNPQFSNPYGQQYPGVPSPYNNNYAGGGGQSPQLYPTGPLPQPRYDHGSTQRTPPNGYPDGTYRPQVQPRGYDDGSQSYTPTRNNPYLNGPSRDYPGPSSNPYTSSRGPPQPQYPPNIPQGGLGPYGSGDQQRGPQSYEPPNLQRAPRPYGPQDQRGGLGPYGAQDQRGGLGPYGAPDQRGGLGPYGAMDQQRGPASFSPQGNTITEYQPQVVPLNSFPRQPSSGGPGPSYRPVSDVPLQPDYTQSRSPQRQDGQYPPNDPRGVVPFQAAPKDVPGPSWLGVSGASPYSRSAGADGSGGLRNQGLPLNNRQPASGSTSSSPISIADSSPFSFLSLDARPLSKKDEPYTPTPPFFEVDTPTDSSERERGGDVQSSNALYQPSGFNARQPANQISRPVYENAPPPQSPYLDLTAQQPSRSSPLGLGVGVASRGFSPLGGIRSSSSLFPRTPPGLEQPTRTVTGQPDEADRYRSGRDDSPQQRGYQPETGFGGFADFPKARFDDNGFNGSADKDQSKGDNRGQSEEPEDPFNRKIPGGYGFDGTFETLE